MIAVNCMEEHLQQALDNINVNYLGNIALTDIEKTGKRIQFSLSVKDTNGPGVLLDSRRRRTASACWHARAHFIDELFEVAEEAEVYSDWAESWITKSGGNWQEKNIGNKDRPLMLSRACDCSSRAQKAIERLILGPIMFRTRMKMEVKP